MQAKTIQYLSIAFFMSLLLYGGYLTLTYIGMPIHSEVFLTEAGKSTAESLCRKAGSPGPAMQLLCRGAVTIGPFLLHTLARAQPFLWYFILCVAVLAGVLLWRTMQDDARLPGPRKPWHVYVLFLVLLWLLFTTLNLGTDGQGRSVRTLVEPTERTYNVNQQGLEALRADYNDLLSRGCLTEQGSTETGEKVNTVRETCMQAAFFTRVLTQVLFVTVLLFELLVLGRLLLGLLRLRPKRLLTEAMLSIALGAGGWIIIFWFMAVFGIFYSAVGWVLVAGIPLACYRESRYWIDRFLNHEWEADVRWHDVRIVLGWLLLSYIALNFLTVVRPFPIGWDDLGSYLNRPRLLVSYGHFIFSMSPFEWSYLTSAGFLLFGYQSVFGATASMMINWTAGLLALGAAYTVSNVYLGRRNGLLSALLYYSLPLVGHFSFADMKIDNAVFFMGSMATLVALLALFPADDEPADAAVTAPVVTDPDPASPSRPWFGNRLTYLLLAGILTGLTFSFKATGIMVAMALGALLAGAMLHWMAAVGVVIASAVVFSRLGGQNLGATLGRFLGGGPVSNSSLLLFLGVCAAIGGCCFIYAFYRRREAALPFLKGVAVFAAGFALTVAPWIEHNNLMEGNIIPHMVLGAPNGLSPFIALGDRSAVEDNGQDIRVLPPELRPDLKNAACTPTGSKEELDRYWGFSDGPMHYLTLPWRMVMNTDAVGYYVTTAPALLLFPLLLLLPYFWTKRGRWLRWTFFSTVFLVLQWVFLANGIPWYGIGMFLGLVVGLEAMVTKAPDTLGRSVAWVLISISLFTSFAMRFWQFEQQRNILEYGFGKISATALEELTIPYYGAIKDEVLARRDEMGPAPENRPYLYRVGTFIPYFIPKNLEVIGLNDHQLDIFNCLYQERDPALTLRRLKAFGFNAIIFDTNTATIEMDPNGSLHKKALLFQDFVNTQSLGLQFLINDPKAGVAFIAIP